MKNRSRADSIPWLPLSVFVLLASIIVAAGYYYYSLNHQSLFIALLAIVAAGAITGWWWRNQRAAFYRQQERPETDRHALPTRFEYLLKHANDIILLVDEGGKIVEANDRGLSSYGYSNEELMRMNFDDLRATDSPFDAAAMRKLSRERDGVVYETIQRRKDCSVFPAEISLKPIVIEGKTYYQGILRDISELKRAEESLREREAMLRESQRVGRIGSYVLDIQTSRWTATEALDDIFGLVPTEERNIETWEKLLHPDDRREMMQYLRNDVIAARKPFDREYRIVRLTDGAERWVWGKGELEFGDDGLPRAMIGTIQDVTERRRTEEALRASELKYRDIFTWAPIGIYQSTKDGRILMANESLTRMLGYEKSEELRKLSMDTDIYFSAADRKAVIEKYDRADVGFASNLPVRWKKKDGSPIWVSLTAHTVRNATGKMLYYEGFVHDITEQKTMEEQVRQAQKLESVGTLASGIAHDFNNILGIIIGHISLVKRNASGQKALLASAESISKAADRGAMLVRHLLTFARKTESFVESVQVNDIILELTKLMEETFPKSIAVSHYLAADLPLIQGDATQLHQVVLNLCVNARDAMPTGGILSIATDDVSLETAQKRFPGADAARYIRIVITDTGTGMDEITKRRIFEPFFTTKGPGKGTGLGMSIVYGIMESHGGFIDVDSIVGTGTTFTIILPVPTAPAGGAKIVAAEEQIPGGTETILIAEDEEMLRTVLQTSLEQCGYKVLVAVHGDEALRMYKDHANEIALVISDMGLPALTGDLLYLALKGINPAVKMILSSGFIEPEMKAKIMKSGVNEFIQKPYVPSEILTTIRRVLDSR